MTKETDNWKTPIWLKDVMLAFCDVTEDKEKFDCLTNDWTEKLGDKWGYYLNPPYSDPLPFVLKAIQQHKAHALPVILLLKHDSTTKWYRALADAGAHFLYCEERLHYSESKDSPPPSQAC